MTDKEILQIVKVVVDKSKDDQISYNRKKERTSIPEYYPTYKMAVENMESIRVHAEKGVFPERLFKLKSPNQTKEEYDYVKSNYRAVTLPVFTDYINTIGRAWGDSNWSIKYKEDDSQFATAGLTFQSYVEKEIKYYGSIENFMKAIIPAQKAIDAMGVVAVKPHELMLIEDEEGAKIDDSVLLEPVPYYYSSKQVVDYKEGEYYLIELHEKSWVNYGNKAQKEGRCFEFYDENEIWIIKQVGKLIDYTFEARLYFAHNWDKIPVMRLMGIPKICEGEILYQSPFLFAVDNLDLVAINANNLQLSMENCAYPYRVMVGDICDFENEFGKCADGYLYNSEGGHYSCTSCNGSGLKSRLSRLGTLLLKPDVRGVNDAELKTSQKPLEFISPSTETLEFTFKKILDDENRARKILHLNTSDGQVQFNKETNTATGSDNNLKALIAFVRNISHQEFTIYEFILNAIGYMRYADSFKAPEVNYPISVDLKTEQDYISEIDQANKVGMPPMVIHTILMNYLQNVYTEKDQVNVLNLIVSLDRLLSVSNDDIALKLSRNLIDKWEEVLHTSGIFFVSELISDSPNFFEQDFEAQKSQLIEKAKAKVLELTPASGNIVNDLLLG